MIVISTLILSISLLLLVPILKDYFNKERIKDNLANLKGTKTVGYKFYSWICRLKQKGKKILPFENLIFVLTSLPLTVFIYFWNSFKWFKFQMNFVIPNNPFSKSNRLLTCVIYSAYIQSLLKLFDFTSLLDSSSNAFSSNLTNDSMYIMIESLNSISTRGILYNLGLIILNVFCVGVQWYPILLCGDLKVKSKLCYFLCIVYTWIMFMYFMASNELCAIDKIDYDLLVNNIKHYLKETIESILNPIFNNEKISKLNIKSKTNEILNNTYLKKFKKAFEEKKLKLTNLTDNFNDISYSNENLMLYTILALIGIILVVDLFKLILKQIINSKLLGKYLNKSHNKVFELEEEFKIDRIRSELKYTMNKLNEKNTSTSLFQRYIYNYTVYFKFSKHFLIIKTISFVLLICLTIFIIDKSVWLGILKFFNYFKLILLISIL